MDKFDALDTFIRHLCGNGTVTDPRQLVLRLSDIQSRCAGAVMSYSSSPGHPGGTCNSEAGTP